jgi:murein tripeptide amidase MpaA
VVALVCGGAASAAATPQSHDIGTSREGTPLRALLIGDPNADVRIVVVGEMHGDEPAGRRVIAKLRELTPPEDTALWLVTTMNPDGHARATRTNARGVDLN